MITIMPQGREFGFLNFGGGGGGDSGVVTKSFPTLVTPWSQRLKTLYKYCH